jgi:predicted dehydrogenase
LTTIRREFLKQGALSIAGMAVAAPYAMAVNSAPKKVRVAIVGGGFGMGFYFHEHPDCIVEAVSDLRRDRRERLMKYYRCQKSYESLEELVQDPKIDAVFCATDGPLHTQHTELAMRHGKHVMTAVPAACQSLDDCHRLLDTVRRYKLIYMMAETSYYQQSTISARKFYREGQFGDLFYCESEYLHPGGESLSYRDGKRTWRYGFPPLNYPTHDTAHLVGVTGERLVEVTCYGWGSQQASFPDNFYDNPFRNESALFKTNRGHTFRVLRWGAGAVKGCERAQWLGSKMSFYSAHPNGVGPVIVRSTTRKGKDDAGFVVSEAKLEPYQQPNWWSTEMLPEPLRHDSGHQGSHTFLTHEFIDAVAHDRKPTVDVYEALSYTAPGIVAHQSAVSGGQQMKIPVFDESTRSP